MSGMLRATSAEIGTVDATNVNADAVASGTLAGLSITPGMVIQYKHIRVDAQHQYLAPVSLGGTPMTQLGIEITPKLAGSLIHVQWFLHGEPTSHNIGFRVQINGVQPNDAYNTSVGDTQWSVLASDLYDGNDKSTPRITTINYFFYPNSTALQRIEPTVQSTTTTAYTYKLNRTDGSAGTNGYETGVSWGVAMEIAQ